MNTFQHENWTWFNEIWLIITQLFNINYKVGQSNIYSNEQSWGTSTNIASIINQKESIW